MRHIHPDLYAALILIYLVIFLVIRAFCGGEERANLHSNFNLSEEAKYLWLLLTISLRRFPPTPGFFLKLKIIFLLIYSGELLSSIIILVSSLGILYLYLSAYFWIRVRNFSVAKEKPNSLREILIITTISVFTLILL